MEQQVDRFADSQSLEDRCPGGSDAGNQVDRRVEIKSVGQVPTLLAGVAKLSGCGKRKGKSLLTKPYSTAELGF